MVLVRKTNLSLEKNGSGVKTEFLLSKIRNRFAFGSIIYNKMCMFVLS